MTHPSDLFFVSPWLMLPFGFLLGAIALGPLCFSEWWGKHYAKVTLGLAAMMVAYYLVGLRRPGQVWAAAAEYISFMAMLGSLFVVSGGIHITVKGEATPFKNVVFLLMGALIANLLGATGASMLLIHPWLRLNKYRVTRHHIVFFIFIVSNVGGCLTPIGPPLFLGYLIGVPFWWVTLRCLPIWTVGVGLLLLMFYVVDRHNFKQAPREVRTELTAHHEHWRFEGLGNIFFLGIILIAVFIDHPLFLREALVLGAAAGSWFTTRKSIYESNHFDFHPIREVAVLFAGIFATMMPALDWFETYASRLGHMTPGLFFWSSGILSSILDNAPTYLCFLKGAIGQLVSPEIVTQVGHWIQAHGLHSTIFSGEHAEEVRKTVFFLRFHHASDIAFHSVTAEKIQVSCLLGNEKFNIFVLAISIGSVFFGAATYIGNGPNFMVKAIAEHQRIHTPHFFEYILKYTLPIMLPMLLIVWWVFFRI